MARHEQELVRISMLLSDFRLMAVVLYRIAHVLLLGFIYTHSN